MRRMDGGIWGTALDAWDPVVTAVLERFGDGRVLAGGTAHCPTRVVFNLLVREFAFAGSFQCGPPASPSDVWPAAGAGDSPGRNAGGRAGAARLVRVG